jgi:hypothetical protein
MRTENFAGTTAGVLVPVRSAYRTQALAVYPAQRFHGKREKHLLAQDVSNRKPRSRKESGPCVFFRQLDIVFVVHVLVMFAKKQVE